MVALNMIDTIGSGIKRMFLTQKNRFFPMPDFDLSTPERVVVRIHGKILDEKIYPPFDWKNRFRSCYGNIA